MLGRLAELARFYRRYWQMDRSYRRWLARHTDGTFGQFYAHEARKRIAHAKANGAGKPPRTLGNDLDPVSARARAESLLEYLKWMGCRPDHLVVDFGCGSLWVGEVLMRYLDPGRYLGMDVVDFFYAEAQARVGPAVIGERQPAFEVISPDSLARGRARNPDFILSTAVLQHVRPREMSDYFSRIVSRCTPSTRVIIGHKPGKRTIVSAGRSFQHSWDGIKAALDRFAYEPRFERPREAPGCQVAMFEIAPRTSRGSNGR